jgi:hypothetical protein
MVNAMMLPVTREACDALGIFIRRASNAELSRSRRRQRTDKAREQRISSSRGKQKAQRLSAQV